MDTVSVFIKSMAWDADDVLVVELEDVDGKALPPWEPGAHLGLVVPAGIRHYSLCGDPGDTRRYRIAVLLEAASRGGSRFVHEVLRPGHIIEIQPPSNHFGLQDACAYRFVAGGIGITPLMPMIAAVDRENRGWSLSYVGKSRFSMAFVDQLARFGSAVEVVARDERPRPAVADLVSGWREDERLYVCGPESLVAEVLAAAAESGWPETHVHTERFTPVVLDPADADAFRVRQEGTESFATVASGESLVTVLERMGVDVDSACREGICGTCRVDVVEGDLVHRDAVLTVEEKARGDVIMACVSRARGELVVRI